MHKVLRRRQQRTGLRPWSLCLLFLCFVIPVSVTGSSDDDYLKAIEMETDKVEKKTDSESPEAPTTSLDDSVMQEVGEGFTANLSIDQFELELRERYTGSAVFYHKLPRRSQEEVYQEYRNGASISEVRKTIMNRFMHQ